MKRALDIAVSLTGGLVLSPLILLAVVLVRLESPGPGLFRQRRVGRDGRPFTLYKLRTMRADTAHLPSHEVSSAAITRLGRVMRRGKLDELPQLWNVLRGEMSLVGPRPCLPSQTELIEARRRLGVDRLRPGVTGVSQVAGIDMSDPQLLAESDATYLGRQSIATDLSLILTTLMGSGRGDRVRPEARR
jgi:O-antigen biosynthesis protein WbqP